MTSLFNREYYLNRHHQYFQDDLYVPEDEETKKAYLCISVLYITFETNQCIFNTLTCAVSPQNLKTVACLKLITDINRDA